MSVRPLSDTAAPDVHPTAVVDPGAELANGVSIGAYAVIGPHVRLGEGTVIGPHVVVEGHTTLGKRNRVYQFSSLGAPPQDLKYKGEPTRLVIGDNNVIREYVTMSTGTVTGREETRIGSNGLFMMYTHVAHDCIVGDQVIFANYSGLGGHATAGDNVVLGAQSGMHQMTRIGTGAMLAAQSGATKDVPPYTIASGHHAKLYGLNKVGLDRMGVGKDDLMELRKAYRIIFQSSLTVAEAIAAVRDEVRATQEVTELLAFIEAALRGIIR